MKIIYVMDPLCGWCYGNSENLLKIHEKYKNELDFEVLPAGMWIADNVRKQSPQMTNFLLNHDITVAEYTGAQFGDPYKELLKQEIALDSEVPSRAIVTIKNILPEKNLPFTVEVQKARYYFGKDLNLEQTYISIVKDFEIDEREFLDFFHSDNAKTETLNTFQQAALFAQSFPTMLMENEGKYIIIEQGYASFSDLQKRIETFGNYF